MGGKGINRQLLTFSPSMTKTSCSVVCDVCMSLLCYEIVAQICHLCKFQARVHFPNMLNFRVHIFLIQLVASTPD